MENNIESKDLNHSGLSVWQLIAAWFGRDYVVLRGRDNYHEVRPVRWLGGRAFAAPHSLDTAGRLFPGGKFFGPCYVAEWLPVTLRTRDLYGPAWKVALRMARAELCPEEEMEGSG